jgi:hypothetical protein
MSETVRVDMCGVPSKCYTCLRAEVPYSGQICDECSMILAEYYGDGNCDAPASKEGA